MTPPSSFVARNIKDLYRSRELAELRFGFLQRFSSSQQRLLIKRHQRYFIAFSNTPKKVVGTLQHPAFWRVWHQMRQPEYSHLPFRARERKHPPDPQVGVLKRLANQNAARPRLQHHQSKKRVAARPLLDKVCFSFVQAVVIG